MSSSFRDRAGAQWRDMSPARRGMAAMFVSTLCFSVMHAAISGVTKDIHPFQAAFFRNLFGLALFVPVFWRTGAALLSTQRLGLHVTRAVLNVIAMLMFFTALSMTPIARVTALGFTAPLFMAALSILVLGEQVRFLRVAAVVAGFVGALIIIRPGFVPLDVGSVLTVGSALIWAVTMIVIKRLSRTETSLTITAYMIIWLSVFSAIPALLVWEWPPAQVWAGLIFIGVTGTFAQLLLAEALKLADGTVVMPLDFLKLVWATGLGWFFFSQAPGIYTLIGAIIIFAAGATVIFTEKS